MTQEPLLSIIILSCNRLDLLQLTLYSLFPHFKYPHWEMIIYNHSDIQEKGFLKLLNTVKGEYIFYCEDDWFFLPQGKGDQDWIQKAIGILDKYPEIKFVLLRQDEDGQSGSPVIREIENGFEVRGYSFGFNPWIAKTETVKRFCEIAKKDYPSASLNIEQKFWKTYHALVRKGEKIGMAKLLIHAKCSRNGVCIHTGYGRKLPKSLPL